MDLCLPFRLERDMVPPLRAAIPEALVLSNSLDQYSISFVETPSIGPIIPDFLMGIGRSGTLSALRGVTFLDAVVLAFVEQHENSSRNDLLTGLHISERAVDRCLSRLVKRSLIVRAESGMMKLGDLLTSPVELVAVEVKLKRWRDAAAQALSYTSFANRSYAILDGAQFRVRPENVTFFQDCGIGLLVQTGHHLSVVVEAAHHFVRGPSRFLALKQLAQTRATTSAPSATLQKLPAK